MTADRPISLNCPACGAPLEPDGSNAMVRCKFCGNLSLLPGQAGTQPSALEDLRQLAASGKLDEAIEHYRREHGVDMEQASQAIDAIRTGRVVTPAAPGMRAPDELTRALEEVQRLLQSGDKIGAIKIYRENYDVSLARAKFAIDQIASGQTARPETGFQALQAFPQSSQVFPEETQKSHTARWVGAIIVIVSLLFVAGVVGLLLFSSGGPLNPHYIPNGLVALVASQNDDLPDFAVGLYDPEKDTRFIGLVNGTTGKLAWKAANLSGDGYADALVAGADLVYAANSTDLLAYRKSDGSQAWLVKMPDKLNYGTSTLLVTAGRVITNNTDQSIQAYDANTGSLVWSKRLTGYDRTLRLMGSSLVVVDYVGDKHEYGLLFLDPASGEQQKVLSPTCTSNDYSYNLDPDSGLLYDQAGNALYLAFDSSYGCVQRIDLSSGQTVWEASAEDGFNFSPDGFQSLMTDSTLYFSSGNDLLAVDRSSGTMKVLLNDPDYSLLPLGASGDLLIVRARRTRGTERFELWGIKAASGSRTWQMDLQGAAPVDPPNAMSGLIDDTGTGYTWRLGSSGLVVLKFQAKPNQLSLEIFNLANGTLQSQKTLALNNVTGDFYGIPTVIAWRGNVAYISLESNIYSLDITTGTLKVIY